MCVCVGMCLDVCPIFLNPDGKTDCVTQNVNLYITL